MEFRKEWGMYFTNVSRARAHTHVSTHNYYYVRTFDCCCYTL